MVSVRRLTAILSSIRLGRLKAPTPHSATFFCARKNATRSSLSGAKNRNLPPERYVQYRQNIHKLCGKILDNIIFYG